MGGYSLTANNSITIGDDYVEYKTLYTLFY